MDGAFERVETRSGVVPPSDRSRPYASFEVGRDARHCYTHILADADLPPPLGATPLAQARPVKARSLPAPLRLDWASHTSGGAGTLGEAYASRAPSALVGLAVTSALIAAFAARRLIRQRGGAPSGRCSPNDEVNEVDEEYDIDNTNGEEEQEGDEEAMTEI